MRTIWFLPFLLAATSAWGRAPSQTHQDLTNDLESTALWAKHLRDQSARGAELDHNQVGVEIHGLRNGFEAIMKSFARLASESPGDVKEGHFIAIKVHQANAAKLTEELATENAKEDPSHRLMKKLAGGIMKELDSAQREHQLELTEIENQAAG